MRTVADVSDKIRGTVIQILSPDVVERIAAGEVIERPVSAVRELLDNALDAGSGEIRIDIRGGGLRSIRVSDNGAGIPADQVDLALRHHATSKIRSADDLQGIISLGFRGEALPSIAAVSELSLATASDDGTLGVQVDVREGSIIRHAYVARSRGTTVTARNLFASLPVRLKFMGDARTESRLIGQLVRRYALANPDVSFHLTLDGHPSLRTSGGDPETTRWEVFGAAVASAVLPLGPFSVETAEIEGFVTGRHATRGTRHHITLLINRRTVHSRVLLAYLEAGYRSLLPRGRHPIALVALTVPGGDVDVNVHPSKAEVKLRHEKEIGIGLRDAVRELLGSHLNLAVSDTSFAVGLTQFELPRMVAEPRSEWQVTSGKRLRDMRVLGQVHGSLMLVEDECGLYLIDQHRAHERAIFELLLKQRAEGRAGQHLLEPLHIQLTASQLSRLEPRLPDLAALGFTCEWFGGRSMLVRSIPVLPETSYLPSMMDDLLDLAVDDESDWQHRLLTSVSCRAATKRGRSLTVAQCQEIVNLLADTDSPAVCPHGSPIILHFSERFLERQFNW